MEAYQMTSHLQSR